MNGLLKISVAVLLSATIAVACSRGGGSVGTTTTTSVPLYAYVANNVDNTVSQFTITANGALTPMSPATVAAGPSPNSIVVDPSSKYVYAVNNGGNTVSQYTIGTNGAHTPMTPATVVAGRGACSIITR